jgi:hypothetical protein
MPETAALAVLITQPPPDASEKTEEEVATMEAMGFKSFGGSRKNG